MTDIEKVYFKNGLFILVLNNGIEIRNVTELSGSSSPDDFTMLNIKIACSESVIESLKKARRDSVEWAENLWKSYDHSNEIDYDDENE